MSTPDRAQPVEVGPPEAEYRRPGVALTNRADRPETADLLIWGGCVLTADDSGTVVDDGAVAVRDGAVLEVGPTPELGGRYRAAQSIDARGCLVLPGLINAHTHLAMTFMRGEADDVDLQEFLARMVAAESARLSPELVRASVRQAIAESVRGGVTSALDMYWFCESAAEAAQETGFRLLAGPAFLDVPDAPDGREHSARLEWARELMAHQTGGERRYLMPHSVYTLDLGQLREVRELARETGAVLHVHAAENTAEVAMVTERHGRRPVELLADLEMLGPDTVLAHAVKLQDSEIALLAETGTAVAHCPISNLKLAAGVARVPELLAAGVPVGLGTDGAVSSNSLDLFTALRFAAVLHDGVSGDATAVPARTAVRMALDARAVGAADRLGSLEPGKRADIIVVDLDAPHLQPRHDPWATLAYAATSADVRDTIVDGRVLMRAREPAFEE